MQEFSPYLFWDTDQESVSLEHHQVWLVTRVLEKGTWDDWKLLLKLMGKTKIGKTIPQIRSLEKKALNFACLYLAVCWTYGAVAKIFRFEAEIACIFGE